MTKPFLDRYARVFGRPSAMMLRVSGLTACEAEAEGAVIRDETGRDWLDFGSFGIHLLGHRHPAVLTAAARQMGRLGLSSKILANAPALEAAERLAVLTYGSQPAGVLFGNSGAEAAEIAIKMARLATGRRRFAALRRGYHGRSDGALRLSESYARHAGTPAGNDTVFLPPGDLVAATEALSGQEIAAVFIEPVQGEGGIHPLAPAYLDGLREICSRTGTLLISDEIQTGLGRCGVLVSCPNADIVLFGKTLAGGLVPVSAAVFRADVIGARARDPIASASSYAGGALAGAVAGAVLTTVTAPGFIAGVEHAAALFRGLLASRLEGLPGLRQIRGAGLMIGLEFAQPQLAGEVILAAAARRLLLSFCLSAPSVVRVYPPAVATPEQLARAAEILAEASRAAWINAGGDSAAPPLATSTI
jgi:acetylornithine/N-succinyldiaminopimelate aminotransferase